MVDLSATVVWLTFAAIDSSDQLDAQLIFVKEHEYLLRARLTLVTLHFGFGNGRSVSGVKCCSLLSCFQELRYLTRN